MSNLFHYPEIWRDTPGEEVFEGILSGPRGLLVERIVSYGHTTPEGEWYDQKRDEWVVVLEGEARLCYESGAEVFLAKGDHVLLPKHVKHRVVYTSSPCVWLAIHGEALQLQKGQ